MTGYCTSYNCVVGIDVVTFDFPKENGSTRRTCDRTVYTRVGPWDGGGCRGYAWSRTFRYDGVMHRSPVVPVRASSYNNLRGVCGGSDTSYRSFSVGERTGIPTFVWYVGVLRCNDVKPTPLSWPRQLLGRKFLGNSFPGAHGPVCHGTGVVRRNRIRECQPLQSLWSVDL